MKRKYLSYSLCFIIVLFGNTVLSGQSPAWQWAKSSGGSDDDEGYSIAVDANGNSYVTGYFFSPAITFGSTILTNSDNSGNSEDIFVVKFDASGIAVWAKSAGSSGNNDEANSVAVDGSGNVYVTGSFEGSITFGSITLTGAGNFDIFTVKYDASGNVLWAKSAGGADYDAGYGITLDASGNSYITGYFESPSLIFGSTTLTNADNSGNTGDIFVVKYDASGNVIWAKRVGNTDYDEGIDIAISANGNVFITGFFYSPTIAFGTTTLTNYDNTGNTQDILIAEYDVSGNVLWAKSAQGDDEDYSHGVAVDANGNSYLTGSFFSSSITFGSTTLTSAGPTDIFIVKYDASGNVIWAKRAGGNNIDEAYGIAVDAIGNSYITGYLTNGGNTNILVSKYDGAGNVIWTKSAVGSDVDYGTNIAVNANGYIYITGSFFSPTLTFGGTALTNADNSSSTADIFIAKLDNISGEGYIERNPNNQLVISGNPTKAACNVTIPDEFLHRQDLTLQIFDNTGRLLQQTKVEVQNDKIIINLHQEAKGVYNVVLSSKTKSYIGKVVFQ